MALEAVVFAQDPFAYSLGDQYLLCHPLCGLPIEERSSSSSMFGLLDDVVDPNPNSSSPETCTGVPTAAAAVDPHNLGAATGGGGGGRRKRRRSRSGKNKEEMENQRMTHIAVERNRRKQMNEYLGVLRSLMPPSYSQRGDQASIIGGAINFVKELEHLLQSMESHKRTPDEEDNNNNNNNGGGGASSTTPPFADFFAFPQYSTRSADNPVGADGRRLALADIEVTMVESHANIKVLVRKRARQLLKLVAGLQTMRLSILHLNVTSHEDSVLYSASVKVEEGCHLNSVDEIAAAVHELLRKIDQEAGLFS
ncbi:hypothetical protein MLD38_022418 [Melastoma candidum]|uniref:Uncharacterized protein n=1 Tax=Melastoma candidum TaxID=119954 RepID=A0ACB9QJD1_9MYRT|nr:hypothetical protein MLD38_022418 [Melastoma candidum]